MGREGPTVRLEARSLSFDGRRMEATAAGGVRVTYGPTLLEADEILLDLGRKTSRAKGRVRLLHGEDILSCDRLEFHWVNETGRVEGGDLLIGATGFHVRAAVLEKTGEDTYLLEDGTFTTCLCPSPDARLPWEFRARKGEVTLGGYAKIRKATFFLYRLPVLYLPRAYIPVRLSRESGFLIPGIGQSGRHGWEFVLPYFWAINASMDATFTLGGLTKRGGKPGVEFRYRPSKKTKGKWNLQVIPDEKKDMVRYGLTAEHDQHLSRRFYDKLDLKVVSDNAYPEDFPGEVGNREDPVLVSRGVFGFREENLHAALVGDFSDVVVEAGGEKVPQGMPHLHVDFVSRPTLFPWLSLGWRAEAVHFMNEEGEHRVREEIHPRGTVSFTPFPGVYLEGNFAVREVLSQFVEDDFGGEGSQERTLLESGAAVEGTLGRSFRWGRYRLHHILRPRVEYQWMRAVTNEPFPVVMDGLDQLQRRNWVTYSLYSGLWGGPVEEVGPAEPAEMLGEFWVVQGVDLQRNAHDSPSRRLLSDLLIGLRVRPRPYLTLAGRVQIDPYKAAVRCLETGAEVWDKRRRYGLEVGFLHHRAHRVDPITRVELIDSYSRVYEFPGIDETLRARLQARIGPRWSAKFETHYLIGGSGKVENHLYVTYLSACRCWSFLFKLSQTVRPDDVGVSVLVKLTGLGAYF